MFDSSHDTLTHIAQVRARLYAVIADLHQRAARHDASKLVEPEKAVFDEYTPKLAAMTYGSPEYQEALRGMRPGLLHHYAVNDHHPEHFERGIHDMDLLQLIEMLADWKAATERHDDGNLLRSIAMNATRFGYGPEIEGLLIRTAERMGWV